MDIKREGGGGREGGKESTMSGLVWFGFGFGLLSFPPSLPPLPFFIHSLLASLQESSTAVKMLVLEA